MSQVIYGASDDLIELRGDVEEEFNVYLADDKPGYLALSTGDLLRVEYSTDGVWEFRMAAGIATPEHLTIEPARGEGEGDDSDGCPGYSQKVVIRDGVPVRWVAFAANVEIAK